MFVLKQWIYFDNISNFNKWKSLIKGKKMLGATECRSTGNDNFATKVISTENVEKKECGRSKKKESNLFIF